MDMDYVASRRRSILAIENRQSGNHSTCSVIADQCAVTDRTAVDAPAIGRRVISITLLAPFKAVFPLLSLIIITRGRIAVFTGAVAPTLAGRRIAVVAGFGVFIGGDHLCGGCGRYRAIAASMISRLLQGKLSIDGLFIGFQMFVLGQHFQFAAEGFRVDMMVQHPVPFGIDDVVVALAGTPAFAAGDLEHLVFVLERAIDASDQGPQRYRDGDAVFEQVRRGDYLPPFRAKAFGFRSHRSVLLRTHHVSEA